MNVVPFLKRLLGAVGKLVFFLTAMITLISQGCAVGELQSETLAWFGLGFTVIASVVGHLMKDPEDENISDRTEHKQVSRFMSFIATICFFFTIVARYIDTDRLEGRDDNVVSLFNALMTCAGLCGAQYFVIAIDDKLDVSGDEDYKTYSMNILISSRIFLASICLGIASAIYGATNDTIDIIMLSGIFVAISAVHLSYPAIYKDEMYRLMEDTS
jgi:hypothetical protein